MSDFDKAPPFNDWRNITVGRARVIYALETTGTSGVRHPEGWALVGGNRTTDRSEATRQAEAMNELMAICNGETKCRE